MTIPTQRALEALLEDSARAPVVGRRYRDDFLAELYDLRPAAQLQHAAAVISRIPPCAPRSRRTP